MICLFDPVVEIVFSISVEKQKKSLHKNSSAVLFCICIMLTLTWELSDGDMLKGRVQIGLMQF